MKDEDMTREQLGNELDKLRREVIALKLALQDKNIITDFEPSLSGYGFLTGISEKRVSKQLGEREAAVCPVKYKFTDLVDLPLLEQLFKSLYQATGVPHAVLDIENNILTQVGWQDICTQFHRVCPSTECRCRQSDSFISTHLFDGSYVGYSCLNGLMDYAVPIIIEDQHMATIFYGQLMHECPDEEFFRRQAQVYGFDEAAYLEALHRVPVISEEQTKLIMLFYAQLGKVLATIGLERKRQLEAADQVIRDREKRLRLALEASNDGFWDWNITTGELFISSRLASMLKYSPEEMEPHISAWEKLLYPDDIDAVKKLLSDHLYGRAARFEAEYRILTKSGEWTWVLDRRQVSDRDDAGRPLRMVGTIHDITDRKLAEATLLQSEEKFSKAFHCNPDLMTITTLEEGRYIEVNESFIQFSGYKRQEIIGHSIHELNTWVMPGRRNDLLKKIQRYGSARGFETDLRSKSGEIHTVCISGDIINIDGDAHLLLTARDITKRKQIEAALRLSEECFSKAFNACPMLMAVTTLEKGRCIKANDAFFRILGYSHEEAIGLTSFGIGFWTDTAVRDQVKMNIIAKQSVRDMEICFHKKTGEQRIGLYSAEGIDVNGELCILSVLNDITDIKKMEVEMTRLDRLNLVGEMAASIGHEIRNPMTTVRGYLQILRENKDYVKEIEYFDLMIEEIDQANSIITEFLSLAKNKMVDLEPGNLNLTIKTLMPLIHARAVNRDQRIKLELNDLPELLLDKKEISQLIHNLTNNGLESMPANGEVTIKTFLEKDKVVLAVRDQGHGIENDQLDKLGTPFFTTKEDGTGLGLAVCYRIAARHNAEIDLETGSTGTTFYVKFPNPNVPAASS